MFSLLISSIMNTDFSGFVIAITGAFGAVAAAVLPVLLVSHYKSNNKTNATLGTANGQGTVVEMLERQAKTQENHGNHLMRLIDGQAQQDERLAKIELDQVGLFRDIWTIEKNLSNNQNVKT